jgi:hypothetical protein
MPVAETSCRWLSALLLALCLFPAGLQAAAAPEPEPTLPTGQLVPAKVALTGQGYRVVDPTRVEGLLGQYRIDTDWGQLEAQGVEILTLRIAEMPALARLDGVTRSEVFADAIKRSLGQTGAAVARVITSPVETVKGIPAGIGRLIQRTGQRVRRTAQAVGDAMARDREEGQDSTGPEPGVQDFTRELLGVNKARRALAQQLGIDPYTGNPLLQQRLGELAGAAVAGGLSIDLALGAISGVAAQVLSVSGQLDDLVWQLPPAEIGERVERRLVARGHDGRAAREFLRNRTFTPTLQLRWIDALEALGRPAGEDAVLALATGIRGEVHARFLIQQLEGLAHHDDGDPVTRLVALEQSISARTRSGSTLVMLPVDHLAWTGNVARSERRGGRIVVAGSVSGRAGRELKARGWRVQAGVGWQR